MTRLSWTLAMVLAFTGCALGPQYIVSDVHEDGGGLVMTKCALDYHGRATSDCHDESVGGDTAYGDDEPYSGAPDPATIRHVKRELDAMQPVARPAPSGDALAFAFRAKGVTKLVELCRQTYAANVTDLAVGVTVQPSGEITDIEPHGVDGQFAECANRALRTANIEPYDGAPVHSELQLAL
jgi:hypothetical protein